MTVLPKQVRHQVPGPHFMVLGSSHGYAICQCGCGYAAVCPHCLPHYLLKTDRPPLFLCRKAREGKLSVERIVACEQALQKELRVK